MISIVDQLRTAYSERYPLSELLTLSRAPGRVNLIGDHTDYNQGYVLPVTLEQGVYALAGPRSDQTVRVYSINFNEEIQFELTDPIPRGANWHNFVQGMVGTMHNKFHLPHGFNAVLYGTVPVGSGLSSSAAVEVCLLLAVQSIFDISLKPANGALLCQEVEHSVIGVQCGIMDQFASRLGRSGHALFLDCRTMAFREIPMDLGDRQLLIVDSHVPRSLATSKYNERRSECDHAVGYLRRINPDIRALRDVKPDFFEKRAHELLEPMRSRARHVIYENARVLAAVDALNMKDAAKLGSLMNASHDSLRDLYEVSCAEVDFLVAELRSMEGVYGARITGAGFGGCVVSLVDTAAVREIHDRLSSAYQTMYHRIPTFIEVKDNQEAGVEEL